MKKIIIISLQSSSFMILTKPFAEFGDLKIGLFFSFLLHQNMVHFLFLFFSFLTWVRSGVFFLFFFFFWVKFLR
jgi:hypothetical protein